jgi:hypothetical protein
MDYLAHLIKIAIQVFVILFQEVRVFVCKKFVHFNKHLMNLLTVMGLIVSLTMIVILNFVIRAIIYINVLRQLVILILQTSCVILFNVKIMMIVFPAIAIIINYVKQLIVLMLLHYKIQDNIFTVMVSHVLKTLIVYQDFVIKIITCLYVHSINVEFLHHLAIYFVMVKIVPLIINVFLDIVTLKDIFVQKLIKMGMLAMYQVIVIAIFAIIILSVVTIQYLNVIIPFLDIIAIMLNVLLHLIV